MKKGRTKQVITKVTKENKALYQALFEKVNQDIGFSGDSQITSLDQFFSQLEQISGTNMVYTVLPLDEPTFDIDANTRVINVPDSFRKNGISVQGDQVSEVIYFTIDRYVDAMDLYREDIQIVIQWETAASVSTANKPSKSEKGISVAYLKDISLFKTEGKMLFGWALNSNITKNAGAIKFSVRFYKINGQKELDFSFSTLTATANIQPGLDYTWQAGNFTENIFDDSTMLKNRIKDSVQPGDVGEAEEPTFLEGFKLPSAFTITRKEIVNDEEVDVEYKAIDLDSITVEGIATLQKDFIVQATGDGYITYSWTKTLLEDNSVIPIDNDADRGIRFVKTEDTVYSGEKLYYTLEEGAGGEPVYKTFIIAPGSVGNEIPAEVKEAGLYERVGFCIARTTGIYTVKAKNKKGLASAVTEDKVLVPGPDKDSFTVELPEGQKLSVYLEDGAEGAGNAVIKILGKTNMVDIVEGSEVKTPGDTIVYTWALGSDVTEPIEVRNIANPLPQEYSVSNVPAEQRAQYDENITASVYATRNGDSSEPVVTTFRLTDKAHAPIVELGPKLNYSILKGKNVKIQATVTNYAEIKHNKEGDEVIFQWYKVVKDEDGAVDPLANDSLLIEEKMVISDTGICTLTFDTNTTKIKNAETGELSDVPSGGNYYCLVTNKVNGSTATNDLSGLTLEDCISITVTE